LSHSIARLIDNCFLFFFIRGKIKKKKMKVKKMVCTKSEWRVQFGPPISKIIPFIPYFFFKFKFWYKTYFLLFLNSWFVKEDRASLDFSAEKIVVFINFNHQNGWTCCPRVLFDEKSLMVFLQNLNITKTKCRSKLTKKNLTRFDFVFLNHF
jgi:hypothetical protein